MAKTSNKPSKTQQEKPVKEQRKPADYPRKAEFHDEGKSKKTMKN